MKDILEKISLARALQITEVDVMGAEFIRLFKTTMKVMPGKMLQESLEEADKTMNALREIDPSNGAMMIVTMYLIECLTEGFQDKIQEVRKERNANR